MDVYASSASVLYELQFYKYFTNREVRVYISKCVFLNVIHTFIKQ